MQWAKVESTLTHERCAKLKILKIILYGIFTLLSYYYVPPFTTSYHLVKAQLEYYLLLHFVGRLRDCYCYSYEKMLRLLVALLVSVSLIHLGRQELSEDDGE